jgi:hypothetical protein
LLLENLLPYDVNYFLEEPKSGVCVNGQLKQLDSIPLHLFPTMTDVRMNVNIGAGVHQLSSCLLLLCFGCADHKRKNNLILELEFFTRNSARIANVSESVDKEIALEDSGYSTFPYDESPLLVKKLMFCLSFVMRQKKSIDVEASSLVSTLLFEFRT